MDMNLRLQLEAMPNKTFVYADQYHFVRKVDIDEEDEKVTIVTSLNLYTRKFESVKTFLSYWRPAPDKEETEVQPVKSNPVPVVRKSSQVSEPKHEVAPAKQDAEADNMMLMLLEKETSLADKMIAVLEDNIKKVQENKDYIPQAQAINNNVNSIINVSKMKLDFIKTHRRR